MKYDTIEIGCDVMFQSIILIIIAIMPIMLLLKFVFQKDTIEKEPLIMLLILFIFGILSAIIVIFLSNTIQSIVHINNIFYSSFIQVALIEEICKWICIYLIAWRSKEFNYKFDAIVYSIFVALGFALVENIGYSFQYGIITALLRAIISVPGHAFFAIYMGYYLGLAKMYYAKHDRKNGGIYSICSILVPTLLHGIYDYCIISKNDGLYILLIIFIITLYILSIKTINSSSKFDTALQNDEVIMK